jgi:hypothetical protein
VHTAARTVTDVSTRTKQLDIFTDIVRLENERYRMLFEYVTALEELAEVLSKDKLEDSEKGKLRGFLNRRWQDDLLDAVCEQLRKDPGAARADMIRHVLTRIYEKDRNLRPAKASQKQPPPEKQK